jgi:ribosomal protein S12 methylthiotransferase accessory factor
MTTADQASPAPRIGFRRHLRAAAVPGEAVYLTSARGTTALSGPHIQALASLLDGSYTLAEVADQAAPQIPAGQVRQLVGKLAQANLVGSRPAAAAGSDLAAEAYWDLAGLDAGQAASGVAQSCVRLIALGAAAAEPAAAALRSASVTVADGPDQARRAGFCLVICDDYLDPELAAVNARQLAAGQPWLLAKPMGADVWIGPVFVPSAGPCWDCLAVRLRAHRLGEACARQAQRAGEHVSAPEASLAPGRELGLQLAALETAKWLAGVRGEHQSAVWTLDTLGLAGERHRVEQRPQCPACGDRGLTAARVRQPVVLASTAKAATSGNGHRAIAAEQVWQRYRHLADPVTGVTGAIQRDPRSPEFLHCYLSGPNLALGGGSLAAMRAGLRQQSGGKGATELEARVGALCEAVERYCGSRLGDEPVIRDSFAGLGGRSGPAVHPDDCQLFHERQFADRRGRNVDAMVFQHVPEPFREQEVIDWTPVWSLTAGRQRLLPTDLLYFRRDSHPSLRANSNGNAAGSSPEDAVMQGLLELVERDAVALWWYNRTRQPGVDLDSFGDRWIGETRERYRDIGRELWVLDVTSDLGVPVMAAVSRRTDKSAEDIMLGFGAHFDPNVAARRALTELGQLLPAVAGARADGTGYSPGDPHIRRWWQTATAQNQPYLCPAGTPRDRDSYGYMPRGDLRDDISHLVGRAGRAGLEVLVLDQTRDDIGMPVVKVIVPGLRHFWARLAPGRLYDVPVALGRLEQATAYSGLNPTAMFM